MKQSSMYLLGAVITCCIIGVRLLGLLPDDTIIQTIASLLTAALISYSLCTIFLCYPHRLHSKPLSMENIFLSMLWPLLASHAIYILYELFIVHNVDVAGWWPLALFFYLLVSFLFSAVYAVGCRLVLLSAYFTFYYTLTFTVILFYTWLTMLIYISNYYWTTMGIALLIHGVICGCYFFQKK